MDRGGTLRKRGRRHIVKVKQQTSDADTASFDNGEDVQNSDHTIIPISAHSKSDFSDNYFDSKNEDSILPLWSKSSKNPRESISLIPNYAYTCLSCLITIGIVSGSCPWTYNRKMKRLEKWKNPLLLGIWYFFWLFGLVQTAGLLSYHFMIWTRMWQPRMTTDSYKGVFAYFLFVYWHGISFCNRIVVILCEDKIRNYINTLEQFNERLSAKYMIPFDRKYAPGDSGKAVITVGIPGSMSQTANSIMTFVGSPSLPWYLTSKIWPKPWYWLIPGVLQDLNLIGYCVLGYCITCWTIVVHANTIKFWLQECHKDNGLGYTREELRDEREMKYLEIYRELRVLCTEFNNSVGQIALPFLKVEVAVGLLPCWYVLIRSTDINLAEEWTGIMMNSFGVLTLSVVGFGCLRIAASMNDISSGFIYSWNSSTSRRELRRTLASFPSLGVKVASYYMITGATTITYFRIIFDLVIDCIITFQ